MVFPLFACFGAASATPDLSAQSLRDVRIAERLRVTRRDNSVVIGAVVENRRDTLTLQVEQWAIVTPLAHAQIAMFERAISTDYEAGARRGFRTGGMIGLAVVGVALYLDVRPQDGLRPPLRTAFAVPLALVLAVVGRTIGEGDVTDEWGAPQRVSVFAQPIEAHHNGVGVGVAFRW